MKTILINNELLEKIEREAKLSSRKRMNYNLHEHLDAKAQRLLNAMEPETVLPVHRHQDTAETYLLLKGKLNVVFYNEDKTIKDKCLLSILEGNYGIHIPANTWHTIEVIESSVIMEIKDGPYIPLSDNDILK
jgi:cupin fold WbuC family metalloprotein